jgi:hypothetical protein
MLPKGSINLHNQQQKEYWYGKEHFNKPFSFSALALNE